MKLTFRVLAVMALVLGLGFGISFGAGYKVGKGNQKTVSGVITAQQLSQLTGLSIAGGGGGPGGPGGTAAAGARGGGTAAAGGGTAAAGGAAAILSRNPTGKVTAIEGNTVTLETRAGTQKLNLSPTTAVTKVASGGQGDLKVGDSIIATGSAKSDGSFDATAVSQLPPELEALLTSVGTQSGGTATGR